MEVSFDILDVSHHRDGLVNVVTEKKNNYLSFNVDDSIQVGEDQMKSFRKCFPGGFYDTISGKVNTMANGKKSVKAGKNIVLDPEVTMLVLLLCDTLIQIYILKSY